MSIILKHFDILTKHNLKVIPLRENTKIPICKNWNVDWNLKNSRNKLFQMPNSNIGLLLGDIVDVEGDDEKANQTILKLIKDYPHPSYFSAKSIHHLFLTPDPKLRHFEWNKIEFRGAGHQSVLPPSRVNDVVYKWTKDFKFPIPPMPDELRKFLYEKRNQKFSKSLKPNHVQVWCSICRNEVLLHQKRHVLEVVVFKVLQKRWECNDCRKIDIRKACKIIKANPLNKELALRTII